MKELEELSLDQKTRMNELVVFAKPNLFVDVYEDKVDRKYDMSHYTQTYKKAKEYVWNEVMSRRFE